MKRSVKLWLRGLYAAAIGGGANGAGAVLAAVVIAPETFNFTTHLMTTGKMAVIAAVFGAGTTVFAYLKQSPLPAPVARRAAMEVTAETTER